MKKTITRFIDAGSLLDHILEQPRLVEAVQQLPPPVLAGLVERVGLEDAGELVVLATTEQLEGVFDQDLWKSDQPGRDESFDADRFALWLEVLVEQGAAFAARKLTELDEDLVTLGLCKHLFVIDIEQLAQRMSESARSDDDEQLDKQLESGLYCEFEQYRVISRNHRSWEAILAVLAELNTHDFSTLARLLDRCCDISTEYIEDNGGLYNVLSLEQMAESDLAAEREDRREQAGHVAPSAALSFLKLAFSTPLDEIMAAREPDPITRAYFRAAKIEPAPGACAAQGTGRRPPPRNTLLDVLRDAGVLAPAAQRKALSAGAAGARAKGEILLAGAMGLLRERDPVLHAARSMELAYLANLLLAGCGTQQRRLRPVEAAKTALAVCNLGAEHALGTGPKGASRRAAGLAEKLQETDLVKLFRIGLKLLSAPGVLAPVVSSGELGRLRDLLHLQGLA